MGLVIGRGFWRVLVTTKFVEVCMNKSLLNPEKIGVKLMGFPSEILKVATVCQQLMELLERKAN
jgi:hypothetical protein